MRGFGVKMGASVASLAVVVGAFGSPSIARADTPGTAADAKSQVDKLLKDRDALKDKIKKEYHRVDNLSDDIDARRAEVDKVEKEVATLKGALASAALAQYQSGPRDAALLTSNDPGDYLTKLSTMTQVESNLNKQLQSLNQRQAYLTDRQKNLEVDNANAKEAMAALMKMQKDADDKLAEAEKVASTMQASERAETQRKLAAERPADSTQTPPSSPSRSGDKGTPGSVSGPEYPPPAAGNTYFAGQCTWFAYNWRKSQGLPVGSNWGNASSWAASAAAQGYTVSSVPRAGAIFQMAGHVGIILRVNGDGTVYTAEMNFYDGRGGGPYVVSHRTVNSGFAQYIY